MIRSTQLGTLIQITVGTNATGAVKVLLRFPHKAIYPSLSWSHNYVSSNDVSTKKKFPKLDDNNPYPTAFPYGNGMVLHFYQQQESSTTKTVHKVINKGLKTYV